MALIIGEGDAAAPGNGGAAPVKDVTTAGFQADVLQESMKQPVIVDLWAPWCGPCKQLGPVLEKAVRATRGKVKMVKINIDEEPQIAQALRVQSIPAVFAFDQGQPVDGFVGAQPESQIKAFVERLTGAMGPSPVDEALAQAAAAMEARQFDQASAIYQQVMQHEPDNAEAVAGLCRALLALGRADDVRQLLEALDEELAADPKIVSVKTQLELLAEGGGDTAALEARVAANGKDFEARMDLAKAYAAADRRDDAIDQMIAIIEIQKDWNDEAAKKQLLKFFEAFGPMDPATVSGRRKLSAAWFS
jgi:putative thioredoxin